jgi:hypothetical protein
MLPEVSCAGRRLTLLIWGRQVSYQTVLIWLVQVAPARSDMPAALAYLPSAFTRVTMEA